MNTLTVTQQFELNVSAEHRAAALLLVLDQFDGAATVDDFMVALQQENLLTDELITLREQVADKQEINFDIGMLKHGFGVVAEISCDLAHQRDALASSDAAWPAERRQHLVNALMHILNGE